MTSVSPRAADTVRKVVAYVAAGIGTVWLLRVLFRVAHGRFAFGDPELWAFLVLFAVMVAWVRAARPTTKRTQEGDATSASDPDARPGPGDAGDAEADVVPARQVP